MAEHEDEVGAGELLEALAAFVAHDGAISGMKGTVGVGIRLGPDEVWLEVTLDGVAEGRLGTEVPEPADALMLLGEEEAYATIHGEAFPEDPNILFSGDAGLMEKFLGRYLKSQSVLGLRAALSRDG